MTSIRRSVSYQRYYLAMLAMDEHVQMMNIEERRVVAEPTEVLEDIPLEEGNPSGSLLELEQV